MYGLLLEELQEVFKRFCFVGNIEEVDENTFKLTLECYDDNLSKLNADFVFQDVMNAFTRVHNNQVLTEFNGIELDYDKFCREGYVVVEKHLENYSETNWEFDF